DPHNIAGILQDLEEFGCPVIQITQSARNLNDATVDIQLLVKSGKVEYDIEDELLSWSMINAALVRNSFGEVKIDKKPHQKHSRIDPDDAFVDAHAVRLITGITECKDKQINNILGDYLSRMGW
ncbi:MAG: terminase TerL endonuclease subunit, partial [Acutalibacteraceae bacterium]